MSQTESQMTSSQSTPQISFLQARTSPHQQKEEWLDCTPCEQLLKQEGGQVPHDGTATAAITPPGLA